MAWTGSRQSAERTSRGPAVRIEVGGNIGEKALDELDEKRREQLFEKPVVVNRFLIHPVLIVPCQPNWYRAVRSEIG